MSNSVDVSRLANNFLLAILLFLPFQFSVAETCQVDAVSAGAYGVMAVDPSGDVISWGGLDSYKIPDWLPAAVSKVVAGFSSSLALDASGNVWVWNHLRGGRGAIQLAGQSENASLASLVQDEGGPWSALLHPEREILQ